MTAPRPEPDSEMAGEPEYGNDTGFAAAATGQPAGPVGAAASGDTGAGPGPEPAAGEEADDSDPGRGAD